MKVLILGGTGLISREVTRKLAAAGHKVTIVNRGATSVSVPANVEALTCDRHDTTRLEGLVGQRTFDAVVDMICFTTVEAKATIAMFRRRCGQIMIVSSVAAYARPLRSIPTEEHNQELWTTDAYSYGYQKAEMERYVQRHIEDGVPITIVRPSLTFGPGARNVGVLRQNIGIVDRIRRRKPLLMFGDGTNPWSFGFSPDIAGMMVDLLGNSEAIGEAVHLASTERTNWNDLYLTFGRIIGVEPIIEYIPSSVLYAVSPERFGHIYFEKSHPGLFGLEKLRRIVPSVRFAYTLESGLRELLESWQSDRLEVNSEINVLEDRLIAVAAQLKKAASSIGR